jgi:hypothetical protein
MDYYLTALGWWNFVGSIVMLGFFNVNFGKKMLNEWTKIFSREFTLDYWSKFWLAWAIGLNIFYGAINITAVFWAQTELKVLIICFDLFAFCMFLGLAIWGKRSGNCGSGIYSVYTIFGLWIAWGIFTFMYK